MMLFSNDLIQGHRAIAFRTVLAWFLLLLVSPCAVGAEESPKKYAFGNFVRVIDGDTLVVKMDGGKEVTVDLWGIDAPELRQPNGDRARKYVENLIKNTRDPFPAYDMWIEEKLGDEDEAVLGIVSVVIGHSSHPHSRMAVGEEIHFQMVRDGWAWHDRKNAADERKLAAAEKEAREAKRGLWANDLAMPPWEWRKQHGQDANQGDARHKPTDSSPKPSSRRVRPRRRILRRSPDRSDGDGSGGNGGTSGWKSYW